MNWIALGDSWGFVFILRMSLGAPNTCPWLGVGVGLFFPSKSDFPVFCTFRILTISLSSGVQIRQTRTLNCRARKDLQLWYSDFLRLTSFRSPNWAHKVLLSWKSENISRFNWRLDWTLDTPSLSSIPSHQSDPYLLRIFWKRRGKKGDTRRSRRGWGRRTRRVWVGRPGLLPRPFPSVFCGVVAWCLGMKCWPRTCSGKLWNIRNGLGLDESS